MADVNQEQENLENEPNEGDSPNSYEKVILAAKLARKLNDLRNAAREQLATEELNTIDQRKVTTVALDELNGGKVQFSRTKEEPEEETFDLT